MVWAMWAGWCSFGRLLRVACEAYGLCCVAIYLANILDLYTLSSAATSFHHIMLQRPRMRACKCHDKYLES